MRLNASTTLQKFHKSKPSILFCHIPKTGGSSVASAIRNHYRFSNFNIRSAASVTASLEQYGLEAGSPQAENALQTLRSSLAFYAAAQEIKFITGHLWRPLNMAAMKTLGYKTMTFLRHPVDRWYSQYFYQRFQPEKHANIDMAFEEFLASPRGFNAGRLYVRYLGGIREDADYGSEAALAQARKCMEEFELIGFLEDIPGFSARFQTQFGLSVKVPHKRQSPARKSEDLRAMMDKYKKSPEIRAQVTALCAPDIELYERARELSATRAQA